MRVPVCLHQVEAIEQNALDEALAAEKSKVKEGSLLTNGTEKYGTFLDLRSLHETDG